MKPKHMDIVFALSFRQQSFMDPPCLILLRVRGVTIQENRIAIYCDIFSLYFDIFLSLYL